MTTIVLDDVVTGHRHVANVRRLFIAGFTGSDPDAVRAHIEELAELGVPTPDRTPTLYEIDAAQLRQTTELVVSGANTSGEVEPVVVVAGGDQLLTIGSDHTDRDVERVDIGQSKRATDKVVGTTCVPLEAARQRWGDVSVRSAVDGGEVTYQSGMLASILHVDTLLARLRDEHGLALVDGDAVFLGTIPVQGPIRPSTTFHATMSIPDVAQLSLEYRITDVGHLGRQPLRKPEIEFRPIVESPWVPADPGVDGQWERILAMDAATGIRTRMLRFDPGTDTSPLGVLRHDFWEEVYILDGALHDLTLGRTFPVGTYACRPPGMPHGPWQSDQGCTTFEVRYPAM